jgi:hypothetical protein
MIDINIYPRTLEFETIINNFPPQPANKFLPEWYKKNKIANTLESFGSDGTPPHAKNCPAIQEEMTNGIVIPAWSDMFFEIKDNVVNWQFSIGNVVTAPFGWVNYHNIQQTKMMNLNTLYNHGVLKLMSPYFIETAEGYGTAFRDPFYHHRKNIRLLPGMVETDIWHETNFPFEFITDTKDVETKFVINAGDPLLMLTPYKKEETYNLNNNQYDKNFINKQQTKSAYLHAHTNKWHKVKKNL